MIGSNWGELSSRQTFESAEVAPRARTRLQPFNKTSTQFVAILLRAHLKPTSLWQRPLRPRCKHSKQHKQECKPLHKNFGTDLPDGRLPALNSCAKVTSTTGTSTSQRRTPTNPFSASKSASEAPLQKLSVGLFECSAQKEGRVRSPKFGTVEPRLSHPGTSTTS